MTHVRQSIRSAVVSALTGTTDAGTNVYSQRLISFDATPSLNVSVTTENSEYHTQARDLQRDVNVVIEGRIKAAEYEAGIENLCEQVEIAMAADFTLGGLAKRIELVGTNFEDSIEAERPMMMFFMTYSVRYITNAADPTTAL